MPRGRLSEAEPADTQPVSSTACEDRCGCESPVRAKGEVPRTAAAEVLLRVPPALLSRGEKPQAALLNHPVQQVRGLPVGPIQSLDLVDAEGELHLLWGRMSAEGTGQLFHQVSRDGGLNWSEAVRVNPDQLTEPLGRGKDARLAVQGRSLLAVWTGPGLGPFRSGLLQCARSEDGGRTWTAGGRPAPPDPQRDHAEHGQRFPAASLDGNTVHVIWIDAQPDHRQLRYARSLDGGQSWEKARILDPSCCACCPNVLKQLPDGRLVGIYRDVAPSDMRLIQSGDGGTTWQQGPAVGAFNWHFNGCPHVGAGLVWLPPGPQTTSGGLAAVVWTFGEEYRGAFALRASEDGQRWGSPQPLHAGHPLATRHPVIARDERTGRLVAAWQEGTSEGIQILTAESLDGGQRWQPPVRRGEGTRPQLAASRIGVCLLWETEAGITALPLGLSE